MQLTDIQAKLQVFARPDFTFDAEPHEYYLGERKLTSFSRWIEDFTNPFNETEIAPLVASKRGCTAEEVLAEWAWSRELGTQVHAWIEEFWSSFGRRVLTPQLPTGHPDVRLRCEKFMALYQRRLHQLTPLAIEWMVYNEQSGTCGMLDLVAQHPDCVGVTVPDWKTNGELKLNKNVNRFSKRMRGPFADLWDTHENKYSLQNSFYRIHLEEAGIPTSAGCIVHLPPGHAPAEIIPAIDYRQRIRSLLF